MREGMGTADGLTIETAARITFRDKETVEIMPQLRRAFSLVEILLRAETGRDYVKAQFARDARLAAWLGGDDAPDAFLDCEVYASEQLPEPVLTRGLIDRVVSCLGRAREFAVVHISGEIGSGRRTFARHCAKVLGRELLMVPFSAVGEDGVLNLPMWRRVLRELLLTDRLLCLCDVKCAPEKRTARLPAMLARMQKDLAQFESPVFITSEKDIKISPFMGVPVCTVAVPAPTIPQSAQLWRDIVGECAAEGGKKNVQITLRCGLRRVRLWQGERLLWLYWVKRMPFWKAVYHLQLYQDGRNEKL